MNPLLIRRRGMMGAEDDGIVLPAGYTKLRYVQGQAYHAYFNTYYTPTNNTRIIINCKTLSHKKYSCFFGAYVSETHNTTRLIQGTSSNDIISCVNVKAGSGGSLHSAVDTLVMHRYYMGRNYLYVDGTLANSNTPITGSANSYYIKINSTSNTPTQSSDDPINVFGQIQFLSGPDTVDRHYVPCLNPSNICGFYCIVTNTFYQSDNVNYQFQPY